MHRGNRLANFLGKRYQFALSLSIIFVYLSQTGVDVQLGGVPVHNVLHHDGVGVVVTEKHGGRPHPDLFALEEGPGLRLVSVPCELRVQLGVSVLLTEPLLDHRLLPEEGAGVESRLRPLLDHHELLKVYHLTNVNLV